MPEQLALFHLPPASLAPKTRHILIAGQIVPYVLSPARRRMSINIDERGLRVAVPRGVSIAEVEAFVRTHGAWVLEKLADYADAQGPRQISARDGVRLPCLGGEAEIRVVPGANRVRWENDALILHARPDSDLDALARRGLQRRALDVFGTRMADLARRFGYAMPQISLSSARTRWGSCSRETGIRLNWRLIHLPLPLIDYVIAHELAHLTEMNHSPRFWAEVERLCPDWEAARAELKRRAKEIPLL
jgi:predicted metal-dependent hydrolase